MATATTRSTRRPAPKKSPETSTTVTRKRVASANTVQQATVPPAEFFDTYVSRIIVPAYGDHGELSEFDVFDHAFKKRQNVLLEGPTGCAKTSAVLAYAAREGKPFYAIPSNIGIEPSQLFGKYIPVGDSIQWVDGPVTDIVRNGGVLLINEVNFMPDRVATVLFGLLDKRRQITLLDHKAEVIDAHDDLLIVADMNPEYEGTRPLNKAFRNRFAVQLPWGYDRAVEEKLLKSKNLLDLAMQLRSQQEGGAIDTPCSTNMLMEFEDNYRELGMPYAVAMFIAHFAQDERAAVKLVLDTHADNIDKDLDAKAAEREAKAAKEKAKKVEAYKKKLETLMDTTREGLQRIKEVDDPENPGETKWILYDDEWGVYGSEAGADWMWRRSDLEAVGIDPDLLVEDGLANTVQDDMALDDDDDELADAAF